ncbi:Ribosomal protein S15P [Penicillium cosmopolitanum]|uniref:Ribosomal protein S15P n=1 Tax=Penicillium cosmopolitanum TaxID=1131564 RepID=A0A9W9W638_9EURO|nr:Ribosomal protein S15P [Penicillium cosmopolitanum]KAJ5404148.1 Ribosomal protein S15P [Penicillium cosmopolitanum]
MGRLHSKGKGIASSTLPYSRAAPAWLKTTPDQVVDHICKLAKKGATPSQIGVVLRDSHGVAQVKIVTGNKILRILKSSGLAPELPEDLYFLIKKAVAVRKHLERNRKDTDSKFRLILIESRIHRLSRYYKTVGVLPPHLALRVRHCLHPCRISVRRWLSVVIGDSRGMEGIFGHVFGFIFHVC